MHNNNMKYLFCDIDGVLNSEVSESDIDQEKVLLLKQIIDETGARLIINSKSSFLTNIYRKRIDVIKSYGLEIYDQIISHNPHLANSKAVLCLAYLNQKEDVDNVLIIDDNDDEYSVYFKYNYILADSKTGITLQDVKAAISILGSCIK